MTGESQDDGLERTLPGRRLSGADPYGGSDYRRPSPPEQERGGGRAWLVGAGSFLALVIMLGIGCLIGVGIGYLLFGRTGEESAANRQPREAADGPAVQSLDPAGPLDTPTPVPTIMVEIGSTADPRPTRTPEPERATEIPVRPQEGAFPPAFTLPSLEGDSIALADYRGQPILLNFWATWCPPCVEEMPAIQAAYESHAREGLVVLAVNSGETADVVEDFQLDAGFTFPILLDSDDRVSEDYNIEYLPTSFFVDVEGIIRVKVEEGMSESDLRRNLEEILP